MNTNNSPEDPTDAQEQALFRRLTQGDLSPEEFHEIEERLFASPEVRQRYLDFVHLEATLEEVLADVPEHYFPAATGPVAAKTRRAIRHRFIVAGVTASLLLMTGAFYQFFVRSHQAVPPSAVVEHPAVPSNDIPPEKAPQLKEEEEGRRTTSETIAAAELSKVLQRLPDAAVVTALDESAAQGSVPALRLGMRLKPGLFKIHSGRVQLDFLSGAMVTLEGPSEFLIISSDEATLLAGHAAANVPEAARGFILNGPQTAVYDLGTEFTLSVVEDQTSEVRVLNGEVEVSLLGDDGNTLQSQRLQGSQMVRLGDESIAPVTPATRELPNFDSANRRTASPLTVPVEYQNAVRNDGAIIYWRFEGNHQDQVPNVVQEGWSGRLVPGNGPDSGISQAQGQLNLSASDRPRFLELDTVLERFNEGAFSIELWVNPLRFHNGSLVSLVPHDDARGQRHLVVVELAHRTSVVHRPGAFRFLYRFPPTTQGGLNLFSQQSCIPGQWHHLVATKTPERMQFYLNGELVREVTIEPNEDLTAYRLFLGELRNSTTERQFIGSLDEVAIYQRALSPEEVATHYKLMGHSMTQDTAPAR